jgi:hypothetical protein
VAFAEYLDVITITVPAAVPVLFVCFIRKSEEFDGKVSTCYEASTSWFLQLADDPNWQRHALFEAEQEGRSLRNRTAFGDLPDRMHATPH